MAKKKKEPYTREDIFKIIIMVYIDALDNIFFERNDEWAKKTAIEDMLWLFEDNRDHPLAYLNICDVMQINNPDKLRKMVYFYYHNKDKQDFTEFRNLLEKVIHRIRKKLDFWEE